MEFNLDSDYKGKLKLSNFMKFGKHGYLKLDIYDETNGKNVEKIFFQTPIMKIDKVLHFKNDSKMLLKLCNQYKNDISFSVKLKALEEYILELVMKKIKLYNTFQELIDVKRQKTKRCKRFWHNKIKKKNKIVEENPDKYIVEFRAIVEGSEKTEFYNEAGKRINPLNLIQSGHGKNIELLSTISEISISPDSMSVNFVIVAAKLSFPQSINFKSSFLNSVLSPSSSTSIISPPPPAPVIDISFEDHTATKKKKLPTSISEAGDLKKKETPKVSRPDSGFVISVSMIEDQMKKLKKMKK